MAAEKTKVKTYRIKVSTLEEIDALCGKMDRKHNWLVQKILDSYIAKVKTQK
jgi:hypothetical protein